MKPSSGLDILLIYDCVYPESVGGVEHRNHEMASALAALGHRVTTAGFTTRPREVGPGNRVVSLGAPGRLYTRQGKRSVREALRLAWAVTRLDLRGYDIVETANIPYLHVIPLALRCRLLGKPLLVSWYEYWGPYWKRYLGALSWLPAAAVERFTARLGQAVLAVSRLTADRLERHRRNAEVHVIPIGISVTTIRGAAKDAQLRPPLVYAGRLQKEKRLDVLVRAVAKLDVMPGEPILTIIGEGPDEERLRRLVKDLGLNERVLWQGRVASNRDVWRLMAGARIAVQPSYREGYGLFPLEAMALGLPVVHCESTESAVSELVRDEQEGLGIEAEPEVLASSIDHLLNNPGVYQRLSAGAHRRAEDYDWSQIAQRLEALFVGIAQADSARSRSN